MKVVCISGKARQGKDTVAEFMKETLVSKKHKVLIAHYADLVKYVCKTFFNWDGEKDRDGRNLLQYVGTDVVRKQNPDYWVSFISEILMLFPKEWDYVLIPDCRFPNEIERLASDGHDITHVRVIRPNFQNPLTFEQQNHLSETSLDNYPYDYGIVNDGTLKDLKEKIKAFFEII